MRCALLVVAFVIGACGADPSVAGSDAADSSDNPQNQLKSSADALKHAPASGYIPADHYRENDVNPADLDSYVTRAFAAHQAFYPPNPIGKLVVFLPGTNGAPGHQDYFMAATADAGFHGINLSYPTDTAAEAACGDDLDCYAGYQAEMFSGDDYCPSIQTLPSDSIHQRLLLLVQHMTQLRPRQGWDAFLNWDGDLYWPSIVFAGLSQGGGHAAWAGHNHNLGGVIMFSSVVDSNRDVTPAIPATWLTRSQKTPVSRYYGFDHDLDYVRAGVDVNWAALDMGQFGGRTETDGVAAPYGGSHELATNLPAPSGRFAHGMVVVDAHTPIGADGVPVYLPVWSYMLESLR